MLRYFVSILLFLVLPTPRAFQQSYLNGKNFHIFACSKVPSNIYQHSISHRPLLLNTAPDTSSSSIKASKSKRNLVKRWITGLILGAVATFWISAGNGPFTLGVLVCSYLAQNEYFTMVQATGINPASKTGQLSLLISFLTAAMFPKYHELVLPMSATSLMLWLLVFNSKSASINEISTSLLGMFYLGYLPSFWVRLRNIVRTFSPAAIEAHRLVFPSWVPWQRYIENWEFGAVCIWWSYLTIIAADVFAYFIGKQYGRNKLGTISLAAGAASPNKTVEGAIGGLLASGFCGTITAKMMDWPKWYFTGSIYGIILGFIALVGDLTASMMKRDAKIKDSGSLLPGHGGVLDRFDSYLFTAPVAFFFVQYVLPLVQRKP
jgi:CDP-diglyceride synthetase